MQVIEINQVNRIAGCGDQENAGGKNEGNFHYVVENKWIKNVRNQPFHYVIEK